MSRSFGFFLVLGIVIFVSGFLPLVAVNYQYPTQTFTTSTTDGVQITYDVTMNPSGQKTAPLAILIHGFSGNRVMMRMLAFALADRGFVCASLDLRGHGSSEGMMGNSSYFNNDVKAIIQSLQSKGIGDTSRIVLVGHSMGGGVALRLGSQLPSVVATVGVAPVSSPDWVNTTYPKNLLLVISTGDTLIDANTVEQTFYKSMGATGLPNQLYTIGSTTRELYIVQGPSHFDILYNAIAINQIVGWVTNAVFGAGQLSRISPDVINIEVYVSLLGGITMIIFAVAMMGNRMSQESAPKTHKKSDLKNLAKTGVKAILVAGSLGSLVTMAVAIVLMLVVPLFLVNFVAAAFLGNAIIIGYVARRTLKHGKKDFSYFRFIKESIRSPSLKVDAVLGITEATLFSVVIYLTMGVHATSTFSTASIRLLLLPLFTLIYAFVFVFYESFFKGVARPMMGDGAKRMLYSVIYELVVVFSALLLEIVITATLLGPFMGMGSLTSFIGFGINLILIPLSIAAVSGEFFYERTGGWIAQIIIGATVFATMSIVFSPVLNFFQASMG